MKIYKFLLCIVLVLIMILSFSCCGFGQEKTKDDSNDLIQEEQVNQEPIDPNTLATVEGNINDTAKILAGYIEEYSPNDYVTCGVLGMMYRESKFYSQAVTGFNTHGTTFEEKMQYIQDWTAKVDAGLADGSSKEFFTNQCFYVTGGYGLCQWWTPEYVETFYDFAREWGTSIGDAEMQCAYVFDYIETNMPNVWKMLCECKSANEAGIILGMNYEGTNCFFDVGNFAEDFWQRLEYDKK